MRRNLNSEFFIDGSSLGAVHRVEDPNWVDFGTAPRGMRSSSSGASGETDRSREVSLWFGVVFLCLSILLGRAWYLQWYQGSHFRAVAEGNRIRIQDIKATRGVLYDRYFHQLVENTPSFSIGVIPVDVPKNPDERSVFLTELTRLSGRTAAEIELSLESARAYSYQPVLVAEQVPYETAIATSIAAVEHPALRLLAESTRQYTSAGGPDGTPGSMSHLFGYLSRMHEDEVETLLAQDYSLDDFVGRSGLEEFYERELKGINGKEQVEVDATGKPKEIVARREPVDGANIQLSLDLELQQYAEQQLRAVLTQYKKTKGSVIVLDPQTGEILALVSLPAFDANVFARGIGSEEFSILLNDPDHPLFNRSVSGEYPSGSTFKLIVGAAGLQSGQITPTTGVASVGGIWVGQWFFPDWKGGGHGWTTLQKAIAESVNTFFYMIGGGYGSVAGIQIEGLVKYAKMFGVGSVLGIDLPHEASGFLPTPEWKKEVKNEPWYIGDTYHVAIGQGDLLVTPMQVAAWTMAFANDGTVYVPHLAKALLDSANHVTKTIEPVVLQRPAIDRANFDEVRAGMRQGVLVGSAIRLRDLPISSAAKTGTAQWSSVKPPHGWTTAFAPYEKPQIVVTVLIEEGEEGSRTAIPVVADILRWWATHRYAG